MKINTVLNKYSLSNADLKGENNINPQKEKICFCCRQPLNNDLKNYYGKICYIFTDYFLDILNNNKEEKLRKKTRRFVTCNHRIHFICYTKYMIMNNNNNDNILKNGFACPLCKK
jgi:hypothetical protein